MMVFLYAVTFFIFDNFTDHYLLYYYKLRFYSMYYTMYHEINTFYYVYITPQHWIFQSYACVCKSESQWNSIRR